MSKSGPILPFSWSAQHTAAALGTGLAFGMGWAHAATWTVNTLADNNLGDLATHTGSLRWALEQSNTNAPEEEDLITFAPGVSGTITLTGGELYITSPVTVAGPGASTLTISGDSSSRVLRVDTSGDVTITGLTLSGGAAADGAGVINLGSNLLIEETVISGNTATTSGGGLLNVYGGNLTLRRCTVSGNRAMGMLGVGGGVYFYTGSLTIENSVISGNSAGGGGGVAAGPTCSECPIPEGASPPKMGKGGKGPGRMKPQGIKLRQTTAASRSWQDGSRRKGSGPIPPSSLDPTSVVIRESIIANNQAASPGGGVLTVIPIGIERTTLSGNTASVGAGLAIGAATHLENCTVSGNDAQGAGGGIEVSYDAALKLTHSTISGNTAGSMGGGIYFWYGSGTLANSLVGDNSVGVDPAWSADDVEGNPNYSSLASSHSLIEALIAGIPFSDNGGNLVGYDPELGPLQNNGGLAAIGASQSEGPAFTQMPAPTSVALNAGDPAVDGSDPTVDQRITFPRVDNGRLDIGAVEVNTGTVQFAATAASVNEGGSVNLSVTRSGGSEGELTIDYASGDGSAVNPGDYPAVSGSVTFAAGDSAPKSITVTGNADLVTEGDENFTVTLTPRGNLALGANAAATVTIRNVPPDTLQFTVTSVTVNESAGSALLTVRRSGSLGQAVSVDYTTQPGSASAGSDFTATAGTLNWGSGDFADKSITVPVANDGQVEPAESFSVILSNPQGMALLGTGTTATVTISDAPGTVGFVSNLSQASETAGSVTLNVARTGGAGGAVSVAYASGNGSALAGSDYTAVSGTLSWADGDSAVKSITVPLAEDGQAEPTESFSLLLSNPQGGATLGQANTTIDILDAPGRIQFALAAISVDESAGTVTLTARRVGGAGGAVSADYATANGSAAAGSDYTAASGTLSWAAGDTADQSFAVPILPDALVEGAENFTAALTSPQGGATLGDPAVTTVTIADAIACPGAREMHPCTGPGAAYQIDIVLPLGARQGELLCRLCQGLLLNGNTFTYDALKCGTLTCNTAPAGAE